jgi:membrane protease YdiL (CAAX protease family)
LLNNHYTNTNPLDFTVFFLFSSILLSPFLEELIFRGTILRGFLSNYNVKKSILYSAVIFGIIHFAPATIICAIILGVFFGWLYYKTGSFLFTFLLHAVANCTIYVADYFQFYFVEQTGWFDIYGRFSILIFCLSTLMLVCCLIPLVKQGKRIHQTEI